jgi:photoactive yellow protein
MSAHPEVHDKKSLIAAAVDRRGKRWREPRYALTFAIEVSGIDSNRKPYCEETHTIDVSDWGCKFNLTRKLERYDLIVLRALGIQPFCNPIVAATVYVVARCKQEGGVWSVGASKIHAQQIWDLAHLQTAEGEHALPMAEQRDAAQYMLVDTMNEAELDSLPYAAFQLNASGVVLKYNHNGAALAGCGGSEVIGKDFFAEIVCNAAVPEFQGRFRDAISMKKLHQTFAFPLQSGAERVPVQVTMLYSERTRTVWVFMQPVQSS